MESTPAGNPISVVIADDHALVRDGLKLILEIPEDIAVLGTASDGREALAQVGALAPDVLLLDLRMPGISGLEVMEALSRNQARVQVVVLTTYNEPDLMVEALQMGALGYLLKDTDRETLYGTIRAAAEGKSLLQPDILSQVMAQLQSGEAGRAAGAPLTEREREVLARVAGGETNKAIARHLGITERTVKAHLTHVYRKLGVDSRASAVAHALREGLLDMPSDGDLA
jgi:NarL family two-component system response regulator YdfI